MNETVTKTMIVKSKGRLYFTGTVGRSGTKAQLVIDPVTEGLPLDSIVTFEGADMSTRTNYGTSLKFRATTILSVRSAEQARELARIRQKVERAERELADPHCTWVSGLLKEVANIPEGTYPELDGQIAAVKAGLPNQRYKEALAQGRQLLDWAWVQAKDGVADSNTLARALRLNHPELADEVAQLRARVAQNAQASRMSQSDMMFAQQPPLKVPVKFRGSWVVYDKVLRRARITEDDPSIYGDHLLGYEGSLGVVVSYRKATDEEAAAAQVRDNEAQAKADLDAAQTARAKAIFRQIVDSGVKPEGSHVLPGDTLMGEPDGYGFGRWLVIDQDHIWAVTNNGSDGADWSANNVRTGGAGAIGWRIPLDERLVSEIRDLHASGARLEGR